MVANLVEVCGDARHRRDLRRSSGATRELDRTREDIHAQPLLRTVHPGPMTFQPSSRSIRRLNQLSRLNSSDERTEAT